MYLPCVELGLERNFRAAALVAALLMPASLLMPACQAREPRPHLVLIVVDSLRADHLGAYGYERPTSPNIDRLAREGVVFTRAIAPSSWTKPSMASLFTSRAPHEHGAVSVAQDVDPGLPTLAEQLRDAGYRTLGVSGNFVHVREDNGLANGFESFTSVLFHLPESGGDSILSLDGKGGRPLALRAPDATELNAEVFARLPPAADGPLFLYVHYMDPHAGYLPPERFRGAFARGDADASGGVSSDEVVALAARAARLSPVERRHLVDLYDAEIAAVDDAIGRLLGELARRGYADDSVVVLVSDHGEEFADHGGWFHGLTLHAESLAVPLVMHGSRVPGGLRREEPVDLLDVPTTLLSLAGVRPAPGMRGRDLLADGGLASRDLAAELHPDAHFEARVREREQRVALLRWPWKAIVARDGTETLYRLDRDGAESRPVAAGDDEAALALLRDAGRLARRSATVEPAPREGLDPDALEGLRALGYAR